MFSKKTNQLQLIDILFEPFTQKGNLLFYCFVVNKMQYITKKFINKKYI